MIKDRRLNFVTKNFKKRKNDFLLIPVTLLLESNIFNDRDKHVQVSR